MCVLKGEQLQFSDVLNLDCARNEESRTTLVFVICANAKTEFW